MKFTCDRCSNEYEAGARNAQAHLFIEDPRCNHLTTKCPCGNPELIYLSSKRIAEAITVGRLGVKVSQAASADLRIRAARAWDAAEADPAANASVGGGTATLEDAAEAAPAEVKTYELTDRHESLIAGFGDTLGAIPDDLLWDGLTSEGNHDLPQRWIE